MAVGEKKVGIKHVDIYGNEVKPGQPGAAYQIAEGDASNEQFQDTLKTGSETWAEENPLAALELKVASHPKVIVPTSEGVLPNAALQGVVQSPHS